MSNQVHAEGGRRRERRLYVWLSSREERRGKADGE